MKENEIAKNREIVRDDEKIMRFREQRESWMRQNYEGN